MDPETLAICAQVTEILARLGISYVLGGSLASSKHGYPRSSNDADMVADIREDEVAALVAAFEEDFYIASEAVADAVSREASFNVIHYEKAVKVDIFVAGTSAFAREELRRATLGEVAGFVFRFASPEDTILAKLRWFRDGGEVSERQWTDVLGVLAVQAGRLDLPYLATTADDLGVADLLASALAAAND